MASLLTDRVVAPFNLGRATDDTDVMARIIYKDGTAAYSVDTNHGGNSLRIVGGGVTTDFLYATYTTQLLLAAAVRAVEGWTFLIVSRGADATSTYLDNTGPVTGTQAGITLYQDTSAAQYRTMTLGVEELQLAYALAANTSSLNPPYVRDPAQPYANVAAGTAGTVWNEGYRVRLDYASAVGTFGSGTTTWRLTQADQNADDWTQTYAGAATTVASIIAPENARYMPIYADPLKRLVLQYANSATTMTASAINVNGAILAI